MLPLKQRSDIKSFHFELAVALSGARSKPQATCTRLNPCDPWPGDR